LYRKTGGRLFSMGHRLVVLTTTGAKSRLKRSTPVVAFPHGEAWVVVAAAGGQHHPGWYYNMVANPDVIVERDAGSRRMIAREAVGLEREAIWRGIAEEEPSFASFQQKTERVIPVMVLEPAAVEQSADRQTSVTAS
jgi:deazaflavin-dependent oxidoreductase (nitroreductase family)